MSLMNVEALALFIQVGIGLVDWRRGSFSSWDICVVFGVTWF